MNITGLRFLWFILLICATTAPLSATAKQVDVKVALSSPVMEANKKQSTFLKVSLTGFNLSQAKVRAPVNVALVLDKSGSMQGEKIERAKEAAILAISTLNHNDIVSVLTYDDVVRVIVPSATVTNKHFIIAQIRAINSGGSTALFAGVSKGATEVRRYLDKEHVNRVILLSDGQANVGPSTPAELGQLGASLAKEGISVTTIGLGEGYNEDLMTKLAGYSDGNHAFVQNASDLAQAFNYEFGDVFSVVAQDVDVEIVCAAGIRPLRILGRDADITGNIVKTHLSQLYSEQEKYVLVEVEVPSTKAGIHRDLAAVNVAYNNMASKQRDTLLNPIQAKFSASKQEVAQATNVTVLGSAVSQAANEMSTQALLLRDEGKIQDAKNLLNQSADYLKSNASTYNLPALDEQEKAARKDAAELDNTDWNVKRKELRAKQYKLKKQQKY